MLAKANLMIISVETMQYEMTVHLWVASFRYVEHKNAINIDRKLDWRYDFSNLIDNPHKDTTISRRKN